MPQNSKAFVRLPYSPRFTAARRLLEGYFGISILKEEGKNIFCVTPFGCHNTNEKTKALLTK